MPQVICSCGKSVETKPEWAGQWITCPSCGGTLYAPFPGAKPATDPSKWAVPEIVAEASAPAGPAAPGPSAGIPAPAAAPVATRNCVQCAETIPVADVKCRFCGGDPTKMPTLPRAPIVPGSQPAADSGGTGILILGILGFMFCQLLSPVAWVMGSSHESKCRAQGIEPSGATKAGKILGIIGTVFLGIVLLLMVIGALSGAR